MKKVIVKHFDRMERDYIPTGLGMQFYLEGNHLEVSDGYHTFDELYEHRITLYIALLKAISYDHEHPDRLEIWRSKLHSDGSSYDGWFILGINKEPGKQITYHLPDSKWEETDFAETSEKAPEFDGHTPDDVLRRIASL